jgi:hypothetical protein
VREIITFGSLTRLSSVKKVFTAHRRYYKLSELMGSDWREMSDKILSGKKISDEIEIFVDCKYV